MDPSSSELSARPATGDVVAGKYRIERVLGRGGMGVVVAARHLQLDQLVALKLIGAQDGRDEVRVERLLREARAAARLRSDHVARVLDVGQLADGAPYIVMEYLEGADLAAVLERSGPLDPEVACDYVVQACEAVAEAHALGIVHRDLKPDNLYLTTRVGGQGLVKVLDFGISKVLTAEQGALTQTQAVVGSPLYMAPEQLRSARRADPRSDVWALGVVLYELLTQRWPFEADSLPDLCVKVAGEEPRPIAALRNDLLPGLVAVLDRCLQKDPARRFANAAELAAALEPFAPAHAKANVESARKVAETLRETVSASAVTGSIGMRRRTAGWAAALMALAVVGTWTGLTLAHRGGEGPVLALAAVQAAWMSSTVARAPAAAPAAAPPTPTPTPTSTSTSTPTSTPTGTSPPPRLRYTFPRPPPPAPKPVPDDIPAFR